MLCRQCQDFNIQVFFRNGFPFRGYPLTSVIQAAAEGCSFCSLLVENLIYAYTYKNGPLQVAYRKQMGQPLALGSSLIDRLKLLQCQLCNLISPAWVHFRIERGEKQAARGLECLNIQQLRVFVARSTFSLDPDAPPYSIRLHVAADQGTPAATSMDITGKLVDQLKISWAVVEFILNWHRNCRKDHPGCNKTLSQCQSFDVEQVSLPSRCIETIWTPLTPEDPTQGVWSHFLRETDGQIGKYIALSHRWDQATKESKTTKANLDFRLGRATTNQPTAEPNPALFVDTLILAYHLGIKYVWIDSICIVQDDLDDWKRESLKMARYYQYSWLTIVATMAGSPMGGLQGVLETQDLPRVSRLPYRDINGDQQGYFYVQCVTREKLGLEYKEKITKSEILSRGWVYQEYLLSRRILSFSSTGPLVQCQHHDGTPVLASGDKVWRSDMTDGSEDDGELVRYTDFSFKGNMSFKSSSLKEIFTAWRKVVQAFSGLNLTKIEQDRFVALAGVAREFGQAVKEHEDKRKERQVINDISNTEHRHVYLCGLWRQSIYLDLQWEQGRPCSRCRVKGIPTWSWASLAGISVDVDGRDIMVGVNVLWALLDENMSTAICSLEKILTIPVNDSWQPQFHAAAETVPDDVFGNENRFVALALSGRLLQVNIEANFRSKEDADIVALLTDHGPDFGRDMWRRVSTLSRPEIIIGWASVEHPEYQTDVDCRTKVPIYALAMHRLKKVKGGVVFGNFNNRHTAFMVLFIRKVVAEGFKGDCFERIGVGRLFGPEVEADYGLESENTLWLI